MSQSPRHAGHQTRAGLTIPEFKPLDESSFANRVINKVLAPIYYLLFSIITAVIVVPVYTIIENFKHGRSRAQRDTDKPAPRNKASEFLSGYSTSYRDRQEVSPR